MFNIIKASIKTNWEDKKFEGNELRGISSWKAHLEHKLEATNESWILNKNTSKINYIELDEAKNN